MTPPETSDSVARPLLPTRAALSARRISPVLWKEPYEPGRGPMHWAGGSYWHDELLRQADRWEALAAEARNLAQFLPDGEDFYDTPARRRKGVNG